MPTPSPKPFNPLIRLRCATLLCLLMGCAQPLAPSQSNPQNLPPTAQTTASASPAVAMLQPVPQDLQGDWIETQQPGGPSDEGSYNSFVIQTRTRLELDALTLTFARPDAANSGVYPYAAFYNGRAPLMRLGQRSYTWHDFRAPMPGSASQQPGEIGFNGSQLIVPATEHSPSAVYYVSKGHDQIVFIPSEAEFNGRITVYLREADARARYRMCLNPAEGNAISCDQL